MVGGAVQAQEKQEVVAQPEKEANAELSEKEKEAERHFEFWRVRARQMPAAAAQVIGAGDPLKIVIFRVAGREKLVWREPEFIPDRALPLNPEWIRLVQDRIPLPNMDDKTISRAQQAAYDLYNQAVILANETPLPNFEKSAQDVHAEYVKFPQLYNQPELHRGKVITLEGRLKRLRKYDAPAPVQEKGIRFVYEGWVFGPTKDANPFCIIFTTLPGWAKEAEEMNEHVKFYGYFIQLFRYRTPQGDRNTPLLIGPAIIRTKGPIDPPPTASTSFPVQAILWVGGLIAVAFVLMLWLQWHFRRGDRAFQARLADIQAERALEMIEQVTREDFPEQSQPPAPPAAQEELARSPEQTKND